MNIKQPTAQSAFLTFSKSSLLAWNLKACFDISILKVITNLAGISPRITTKTFFFDEYRILIFFFQAFFYLLLYHFLLIIKSTECILILQFFMSYIFAFHIFFQSLFFSHFSCFSKNACKIFFERPWPLQQPPEVIWTTLQLEFLTTQQSWTRSSNISLF